MYGNPCLWTARQSVSSPGFVSHVFQDGKVRVTIEIYCIATISVRTAAEFRLLCRNISLPRQIEFFKSQRARVGVEYLVQFLIALLGRC